MIIHLAAFIHDIRPSPCAGQTRNLPRLTRWLVLTLVPSVSLCPGPADGAAGAGAELRLDGAVPAAQPARKGEAQSAAVHALLLGRLPVARVLDAAALPADAGPAGRLPAHGGAMCCRKKLQAASRTLLPGAGRTWSSVAHAQRHCMDTQGGAGMPQWRERPGVDLPSAAAWQTRAGWALCT